MEDFLDDSSESLKTDEEGNYYAFFEEKKILKAGVLPKVEDKEYASIGKDVENWNNDAIGTDGHSYEETDQVAVELILSDNIHQLDSILLRKGTLQVDFTVKNLTNVNDKVFIDLSVELPKGYFLKDGTQKKDSTFTVEQLEGTSGIRKGSLPMKLHRIIPGENDVCTFSYTLRILKDGIASCPPNLNPRFDATASLKDIEYEVIYGKFATATDIEETVIDLEGFDSLFEDEESTLSFANPHIELIDTQKIGIPILFDMTIVSDKESATITDLRIEPPVAYTPDAKKVNRIWIGDTNPNKEDFVFEENKEIAAILGTVPKSLTIHGKAFSDSTIAGFYVNPQPDQEVFFAVKVPLEPAESFRITSSETLSGVFDEDLLDLLFSNGEIELSGEINNELPLDMALKLDIVDADGVSIGIKWKEKTIEALGKSEVSFLISEEDMPLLKEKEADGILVFFTATGSKNAKVKGVCLNKDQKIDLKLKFKKKGGIVLGEL
jgi:hypothetical protein